MITLTTPIHEWTLDSTLTEVDHALFIAVRRALEKLHAVVALLDMEAKRKPDGSYAYTWHTQDGRQWKQHFEVAGGEIHQSFDIPDHFIRAEFSEHRALRDLIERLILDYALVK